MFTRLSSLPLLPTMVGDVSFPSIDSGRPISSVVLLEVAWWGFALAPIMPPIADASVG